MSSRPPESVQRKAAALDDPTDCPAATLPLAETAYANDPAAPGAIPTRLKEATCPLASAGRIATAHAATVTRLLLSMERAYLRTPRKPMAPRSKTCVRRMDGFNAA